MCEVFHRILHAYEGFDPNSHTHMKHVHFGPILLLSQNVLSQANKINKKKMCPEIKRNYYISEFITKLVSTVIQFCNTIILLLIYYKTGCNRSRELIVHHSLQVCFYTAVKGIVCRVYIRIHKPMSSRHLKSLPVS